MPDPIYEQLLDRAARNIECAKQSLKTDNLVVARFNAKVALDTLDYFDTRMSAALGLGVAPTATGEMNNEPTNLLS